MGASELHFEAGDHEYLIRRRAADYLGLRRESRLGAFSEPH